jgi:hypothetical protein
LEATSKSDANDYKSTQHSYGFWAVPPDIDTEVMVIFAKGEANRRNAFWIGCIQQPLTNHQVPGYAASSNNIDDQSSGREKGAQSAATGKRTNYDTNFLPVGEKNRAMIENAQTASFANSIRYPINDILAEQLVEQGLIKDDIRGTTSSSARRESPSQVFGISTPGRIRADSRTRNIGVEGAPIKPDRMPGHSFVMDDGDVNSNNQLTRLRTASGHQLLMHDTHGVVYIANGSGNSWLEMSPDGKILIYAQDGFNLRSDGNFDLHSGGDINFHAKNSIKFHAEVDLINSANYIINRGVNGIANAAPKGGISSWAGMGGISSFGATGQNHGAGGQIHLAGAEVHFNSTSATPDWGPNWLKDLSATGIVEDNSQNDVNIYNVDDEKITVGTNSILKANTKKTKTTVPNLVTHEPFTRAPSGITENISEWQNPKEWKKLSETPGTLEYYAQQNRKSPIEYIKQLQFLTDSKKFLADKGGKPPPGHPEYNKTAGTIGNINLTKAKELSDAFTKNYNKVYNVKSVVENLSRDNIKNLLITKVTAGRVTSIASIASTAKGFLLGKSSASNVPPSMRGTLRGNIMQVGARIKSGISKVFSSFFSKK